MIECSARWLTTDDEVASAIKMGHLWFFNLLKRYESSSLRLGNTQDIAPRTARVGDPDWRDAKWLISPINPGGLSDFHIHGLIASLDISD